jgi:hypothetical protein
MRICSADPDANIATALTRMITVGTADATGLIGWVRVGEGGRQSEVKRASRYAASAGFD